MAENLESTGDIPKAELKYLPDSSIVVVRGEEKKLAPDEDRLFDYFHNNSNRILSRRELWEGVYPEVTAVAKVDRGIRKLREKLESDPKNPKIIVTMHGKGYIFVDPVNPQDSTTNEL